MSFKKRSRNYVDTYVQGALVRRVVLHWFVFFFTTTLAFTAIPALFGDPAVPYLERIKAQSGQVILQFFIMISLLPAFILDTVKISNRFVGPVSRLRKAMRTLASEGEVSPLQFRKGDFWREIGEEFNKVASTVSDAKSKLNTQEHDNTLA